MMHTNKMVEKTETFGFDFDSVYARHNASTCPTKFNPGSLDMSNETSHYGNSFNAELTSVEEMVEELREATEKALHAIDEEDGLTAAEIMTRRQKDKTPPAGPPAPTSRTSLREMEEHLSVERTLDEILNRTQLAVSRNIIWGASLDDQIWRPLQTDAQISNFLHSLGIHRYRTTIRWFANRVSGDPTFNSPGFFETTNLWGKVSFADGLLDVRTNAFTCRCLEDRVTAVLRYSYHDISSSPNYEKLTEAMKALAVTEESYLRLQEICGVALHAEPSGRILYFQHWNPRVASLFTKLLSKVWSEDSVSFLGLRDHEKSFRTAQVLEHPIVISGKEGESTLRDISTVLALADSDGINVDRKNQDPFDFVSRCSLICAGRNLPPLQKGSMETLRYYLIRVNLTGDMSDCTSIRDILTMPKEFILWSLEGLHRFISNNGKFTFDEGSDIPREDASILTFVEEMIESDPQGKIPSSALYEAYASFCEQNEMVVLPKARLISYLRETFLIESRTIRVSWYNGGRPVFGYVGIRFSEEYQQSLEEPYDDPWSQNQDEPKEEDCDTNDEDCWAPNFESCGELLI